MRRLLVAVSAASLVVLGGSVAVQADALEPRLAVYPSGPVEQITRDLGYAAFPYAAKTPGGYVLAHGLSTSHYGTSGRLMVRRSTDGIEWTDGVALQGLAPGYSWGPAGVAAETAGQGGRTYLLLYRAGWYPNSQTVSSVAAFLRYSDDSGRTWQDGGALPGAGPVTGVSTFWFLPNDIAVLSDGTLLASGYSNDRHARYLASVDRGESWAPAGDVTTNRRLEEPTLCELPDGRVLSLIRSDDPSWGQRLFAVIRGVDGTWGSPYVITYDGSGRPDCTVINSSTVFVPYRGWVDRADESRRPMRAQLLGLNADGRWVGYRGNVDLRPGVDSRWLYGEPIRAADGWRVIAAFEGPNGATAASAQVVSIPIGFREAP